jgi:hypothetical protein
MKSRRLNQKAIVLLCGVLSLSFTGNGLHAQITIGSSLDPVKGANEFQAVTKKSFSEANEQLIVINS